MVNDVMLSLLPSAFITWGAGDMNIHDLYYTTVYNIDETYMIYHIQHMVYISQKCVYMSGRTCTIYTDRHIEGGREGEREGGMERGKGVEKRV